MLAVALCAYVLAALFGHRGRVKTGFQDVTSEA
jgi:hypothetical protein